MATIYPYYVVSHLSGGILKTWKDKGINFPNSAKFNDFSDALAALRAGLKRREEFYERTGIHCDEELTDQYVIMKYTGPYESRIEAIWEKGHITHILNYS